MKIFRLTMICLWALVLITGGTINSEEIVNWANIGTLQMGSNVSGDSIIYMFPKRGTLRYAINQGNIHFRAHTNRVTSGAVENTDSITITYQCLGYANTSFATPAVDLEDGTIESGGTDFPVFANVDWDSGGILEYPNLTSVLYPYGPCQGLLIIGTYSTADDSDSVSVPIFIDEQ